MTPKRLSEHREALAKFHNAYIEYLEAASPQNHSTAADEVFRLRGEASDLIPAAQAALYVAHVNPTMTPPPAFGGPVRTGLANTAFAHELPGFRLDGATIQLVIDAVRYASAELANREQALRRRQKNPLYWIDRLLRAVLGIPKYLLSLVLGVPVSRIDESPFARTLSILSALLEVASIYVTGHVAHWW